MPDYRRMKQEIIASISAILENINHYKLSPNLIRTIDNIEKITKSHTIVSFLRAIPLNLDNLSLIDQQNLNLILTAFIAKNQPKYLKKISHINWTIYEYEHYFMWFVFNKRIDMKVSFDALFPNKIIASITIDHIARNDTNIENLIDDLKHADHIKLKILK